MKRVFLLSAAILGALGIAEGGQINIGYTNGTGNYGLVGIAPAATGNIPMCGGYIQSTVAGCPTYTAQFTNMAKINYDQYLFQQATTGGVNPTIPTATSAAPNTLTTTDGATFALMGGNTNTLGNGSETGTLNAWLSSKQDGTSTIYVPINDYGVDSVYTLLNDLVGSAVQITFDFNSSDTLAGATQVVLDLTDGLNIRSNVLCGTPGVSTGCVSGMYTSLTAGLAGTDVAASNLPSGTTINVSTGSYNVGSYNSIAPKPGNAYGLDSGSTGTLTLDDQAYHFNSLFTSDWLVGLSVTELATNGAGTSANEFALSAVSVDIAAPEPGTVALSLGGLILLVGVAVVRRKRTTVQAVSSDV